MAENYISTTKAAKILGISRVAVFKKIKNGQIKARKIGRNFVIEEKEILGISGKLLSEKDKKEIEAAVRKTVRDYGETLKLLGRE